MPHTQLFKTKKTTIFIYLSLKILLYLQQILNKFYGRNLETNNRLRRLRS